MHSPVRRIPKKLVLVYSTAKFESDFVFAASYMGRQKQVADEAEIFHRVADRTRSGRRSGEADIGFSSYASSALS
jgi:hypothetical protein